MPISNILNREINVIPIRTIPIKTEIIELILCFTISVSFVASNLGYFKLIMIPINSEVNGIINVAINIRIMLIKSNLNLIKIIISPIIIHGIMIVRDANTLYKTILKG